jgi:uncharacterized protein (TIGR02145 family)
MRNSIFVLFLLFTIPNTNAQDYSISFTGVGDTNVVSSVRVDNLTTGNSVTLNSGDTLHLKYSLGFVHPDIEKNRIQLYPNPTNDQSILTFVTSEQENTVISIVDLSGKTVYQTNILLSAGTHSFRISGVNPGIFFVNVTAKNFHHSVKLICQGSSKSHTEIEIVSFNENAGDSPYKSTVSSINMQYTEGDILLFKGTTGPYSAIITDTPGSSKTLTFNFVSCNDYDGNNYTTVEIGDQTWMAENLKAKHFKDGTEIALVENNSDWNILSYTSKAYCYYVNSVSYGNTFGALYTWAAAMNGDESSELNPSGVQGACPCGWHLPSDEEWMELEMYLGMTYEEAYGLGWRGTNEGDKLKTTNGWFNNGNGTNASGFSALPGGSRINALFVDLTEKTCFWSTTEYFNNHNLAFNRSLSYLYSQIGWFSANHYYGYPKNYGLSVRCIKD